MTKYNVTGMSCAACSARVEKAVSAIPEVSACSVNLLTNTMNVEGSDPNTIIGAVRAAGYDASVSGKKEKDADKTQLFEKQTKNLRNRLISSVILLCFLMYLSMGHIMWGWPLPKALEENFLAQGMIQLLLTIAVMVINQRFFINGFTALWRRSPNMDSLVALGSGAAFCYSTYALFAMSASVKAGDQMAAAHYMHEFYFESAAMILALITVGKMLESRSKGKTTNALKGLMDLAPKTAVIVKDDKELIVPVEQVQRGDVFVVRPGEVVPVDGVVVDGHSAVDESALTGESIPVDKAEGNSVSAATVNRSGFIRCKATAVGEDTTLSKIIKMVSDASASKAPIAKIADRVSGVFVPVVIGIAVVTIAVWLFLGESMGFALARGISVLVISCPCALGLATPVAIMVGSGVGAKNGILFKTATSLEQTGKIRAIALDKTGTITEGKPGVTDLMPLGITESQLLRYAYALEYKSEHPLATAVVRCAEEHGVPLAEVKDFEVFPGNGLSALLDEKALVAGNAEFVGRFAEIDADVLRQADGFSWSGKTPMYFAYDGKLVGLIAVADVVKSDSSIAIERLQKMGIRVIMLTGDNEQTARAIAAKAGIQHIVAGVLPEGKEEQIALLSARQLTAMVGDGINDAPALTRADIGIAIGAGADVAMDAADVVLMNSRLTDVVNAIRLSRATLRTIKQNLFWAFVYNVIGIPLAAGVFIHWLGWQLNPMFGAAAMSLSSFCVVSNALRLNFFKPQVTFERKEHSKMEKVLKVEGMMCPHCEAHLKNALEALDGVTSAIANHKDGTVSITMSSDVSDDLLKRTVEAAGYSVIG